jgi:Fic family protein
MTMYPFDEGNGRIARAIAEMVLSQSDGQSSRFYSMSIQIYSERTQYRDILERTQKGPIDVSEWLHWFFSCLMRALKRSDTILQHVEFKHRFWMENAGRLENDRQKNIMNMLLDGFEGKLTTSAWAELGNCSQDTALRDIQMLLDRSVLFKLPGGGRSTAYDIAKHDS